MQLDMLHDGAKLTSTAQILKHSLLHHVLAHDRVEMLLELDRVEAGPTSAILDAL